MSRLTLPSRTTTAVLAALVLAASGASLAADAGPGNVRAKTSPPVEGAPAPAGATDPLERLRQRLADRLAGAKGNAGGGATSLQVVNMPPAQGVAAPEVLVRPQPMAPRQRTPAAASTRASQRPKSASTTGNSHRATQAGTHWSYSGEVGPQAWGGIRPEFSTCANGERQSPIDIREGIAVDLDPVQFRYQPSAFSVIDNGQTVQVNLAPGNSMEVGGRRYELLQFHFHRPSEESIDGRQFELSVHLVHKDPEGRLAVVGVLLGKGAAQPVVQTVWNNLPLEKHQDIRARVQLDPNELLPTDRRYYTYMGSLTTPPCSEGVQWVVMRQPVAASPDQIDIFSRLYPMNARPVQNAAGRRILQSR